MAALLMATVIAFTGIARAESPALVAVARHRANEMAVMDAMGEHRYLYELNNGRWASWGEVLGWNRYWGTRREAVRSVARGWMRSLTHRAILMNRSYEAFGCAVSTGDEYHEWYFVCVFGNRAR